MEVLKLRTDIDGFQKPMLESMVKTEDMWGEGGNDMKRRRLG